MLSPSTSPPGRVRYPCSTYPRHGRKDMGFCSSGVEDIPDLDTANEEGIADEGTVTAQRFLCMASHTGTTF